MSKSDSLLSRMGNTLGESIGIRPGQGNRPTYSTGANEPPKTDFVRNRSVGEIHPSEVMPDPEQPRKHFDQEEIERLSADIKQRGQLQPIRVRWSGSFGKWLIIAGERRWRAVSLAGLDKITCVFIDKELSENEIRAEQLVENLLREDLNGMELAKSFSCLMEINKWSATELGQQLNINKSKVSKALALLKLPKELQAKIEAGEISPSSAYELAKVRDVDAQRELAAKIVEGGATQPELAQAAKKLAPGGAGKPRRSTNESFRTGDNVKVSIVARKDLGDAGMIQALIEVAESIRKRSKGSKAA